MRGDRAAGVSPALTEHLHEQVGGAVDDLGMLGELRRAGDEATEAQAGADSPEIAVEGRLDLGQDVDRTEARRRLTRQPAPPFDLKVRVMKMDG